MTEIFPLESNLCKGLKCPILAEDDLENLCYYQEVALSGLKVENVELL